MVILLVKALVVAVSIAPVLMSSRTSGAQAYAGCCALVSTLKPRR